MYALRGGFLIRPLAIAVFWELLAPRYRRWKKRLPNQRLDPKHPISFAPGPRRGSGDPEQHRDLDYDVVSIVFAILLMTLTLASTQFSPRILISFVRDRTTQWTLGVFLGAFSYCMAALPAARALPHPFLPVATVTGTMVLALVCVGWLIYFINHISQSISVNQITS